MRGLILNGSGTGGTGIFIQSGASNNVIEGCFIGTGVSITSASVNLVGGAAASLGTPPGNVISGNTGQGVSLGGGIRQIVEGNLIGTDATGTNDLGNGTAGILLNVQNSVISNNVVSGNTVVAFNGDHGVQHAGSGSTNNMICFNSIFSNAKLGINLFVAGNTASGATSNDTCDADAGANFLQNYPVLTTATSDVNSVTIAGFLPSTPNTTFLLEFFANTACDPSGHGEGEFFIGATNVTTAANCTNVFTVTFPVAVADAMLITATATDPTGNTSKFFACRTNVSTVVTPVCSVSSMLSTNQPGNARALTTTITTNGVPVANRTFTVNRSGANGALQTNLTTAGNGQATFTYTGQNTGTDFFLMAGAVGGTEFSCDATVVWINNNVAPQITCPGNITTNVPADVTEAVVEYNLAGSDNCPDVLVTGNPPSGTTFPLGVTPVSVTAVDTAGNTNTCAFTVTVTRTAPTLHDLALVKMKAPKNINLQGAEPSLTKFAVVTIQNLSNNAVTITSYAGLVTLIGASLGETWPNLAIELVNGPANKALPVVLGPKKKRNAFYNVTYNCANFSAKGVPDFEFTATVNHAAIDGNADSNPANDNCPRAASGVDKGCAKGLSVQTDVIAK